MPLLDFPILYEDEVLLVINKPAGVVVNKSDTVKEQTVQDWAQGKLALDPLLQQTENKDFYDRAGIVHRIDKETTGILLIAKNPLVFSQLQRQFKERVVKKVYRALVHGSVVPKEGEIRAPVGRLPWNRERFGIVPGGKEAVTRYKVISDQPIGDNAQKCTLIELYPETGRTHQIRVHLKYINHPIVGDYLYAGRKTARDDRVWATRVMLHAYKISLIHPVTKKLLEIEAPIPDDMMRIISFVRLLHNGST